MILDNISFAERYLGMHKLFRAAFDFVRNADFTQLNDGRHVIEGEQCYAIVATNPARTRGNSPLEAHRRYIDLQYIITGQEEIGWRSLKDRLNVSQEYEAERDIVFFGNTPQCWLALKQGTFGIFFPEDAHAPGVSSAPVRKVVVKIAAGE